MYKPLGLCLNDFDISYDRHKKRWELIHIQGPPITTDIYDATVLETSYGRAVSNDLVNWEVRPNAFGISEKDGVFDNSAIWTMQTLYDRKGRRAMLYTGLNKNDYFIQKIGLAYQDQDTEVWHRNSEQPVLQADDRYYQTKGRMAWRDPFVIFDEAEDRYVMFLAAKDRRYTYRSNGCVALAFSHNLQDWDVQPPLISPDEYDEFECPVYYQKGKYHYLLISIFETHRVHIFRSTEMLGDYEEIGYLTQPRHYASRIIELGGDDLLLGTQWVQRTNKNGQKIWSRGYLDDPMRVVQDEDGMLHLEEL